MIWGSLSRKTLFPSLRICRRPRPSPRWYLRPLRIDSISQALSFSKAVQCFPLVSEVLVKSQQVIINKPPLKRGKGGSHFLMRETQKGYSCCTLLSGGLLILSFVFLVLEQTFGIFLLFNLHFSAAEEQNVINEKGVRIEGWVWPKQLTWNLLNLIASRLAFDVYLHIEKKYEQFWIVAPM